MIKKLFSIGFAAFIGLSAVAQSAASTTAIPSQVQMAFQGQFPNVSNVTWNEEAGYFQPKFSVGGVDQVGYIDLKGHYIQTIAKVGVINLPAAVSIYISQNFQGAQITDAGRIDFPNGMASRFYATVGGKQLLFDNKGNFIKETASTLKQ